MKNKSMLMLMLLACRYPFTQAVITDPKDALTNICDSDPMPSAPPLQEELFEGDSHFLQGSLSSLAPAVIAGVSAGTLAYYNQDEKSKLNALALGASTAAAVGAGTTVFGAYQLHEVNKKRKIILDQGRVYHAWLNRVTNSLIQARVASVDQEVQACERMYRVRVRGVQTRQTCAIEEAKKTKAYMNDCLKSYPNVCRKIDELEQSLKQTEITDEDRSRAKTTVDSEITKATALLNAHMRHQQELYNVRMQEYKNKRQLYDQMTSSERERSEKLVKPERPQVKYLYDFFSDEMKACCPVTYNFVIVSLSEFDRPQAEQFFANKYANERFARARESLAANEQKKRMIEQNEYHKPSSVSSLIKDLESDIAQRKSFHTQKLQALLTQRTVEIKQLNEKKEQAAQKTDSDEQDAQDTIIKSCNDEKKSWYTGITFGGIGSMLAALAVWVGYR